jgi:hypothetical protein
MELSCGWIKEDITFRLVSVKFGNLLFVNVREEGDPLIYYALFASFYVGFLPVPKLINDDVVIQLGRKT